MDLTPVCAKRTSFAARHARVQRCVRVVETLCAYEVRASNEQGRGNGSHSEIAHGISQRRYRALAAMACAACTTEVLPPTLRQGSRVFPCGNFFRSFFPDAKAPDITSFTPLSGP